MLLTTAAGSRLAVVDNFNRECLALAVDTSLSGLRIGHELRQINEFHGHPANRSKSGS